MFPYLIATYITWFSKNVNVQSVITTLAFSNAPFSPRDHYQYYIVALAVGEALGRSYLAVLSKAEWAENVKFPYLWVFCDNSNHLPSLFYLGGLVSISSECVDRFTVNIYQRSRGRRFLRQHIGILQG